MLVSNNLSIAAALGFLSHKVTLNLHVIFNSCSIESWLALFSLEELLEGFLDGLCDYVGLPVAHIGNYLAPLHCLVQSGFLFLSPLPGCLYFHLIRWLLLR